MHNTNPEYWEALGFEDNASRILAYIAGDQADMPDMEVLATFVNDNASLFEEFHDSFDSTDY